MAVGMVNGYISGFSRRPVWRGPDHLIQCDGKAGNSPTVHGWEGNSAWNERESTATQLQRQTLEHSYTQQHAWRLPAEKYKGSSAFQNSSCRFQKATCRFWKATCNTVFFEVRKNKQQKQKKNPKPYFFLGNVWNKSEGMARLRMGRTGKVVEGWGWGKSAVGSADSKHTDKYSQSQMTWYEWCRAQPKMEGCQASEIMNIWVQ